MRTGKIARLPHRVREELDQRLANGAKSDEVLAWLNGLPEVQAVLHEQFGGRPVIPQNLSNWRLGGHQEWCERQQARLSLESFTGRLAGLRQTAGEAAPGETITNMHALVLTQAMQMVFKEKTDLRVAMRVLQTATRGVVALRQMSLEARRERLTAEMKQQREKLEQARREFREKSEIKN
jgi:hypothetical protein